MAKITLPDLRLSEHTLATLPRLAELRRLAFVRRPTICIERALYVTEYLRDHDDPADDPVVRQAKKVSHFLERKAAVFHDANLLAGTTTSKPLGAPLFPEFFALALWPELETIGSREKNPQQLSPDDARKLNTRIFPFWLDRSVLEVARKRFGNPPSLRLFQELVFFIASKAGCISHAVPTYVGVLERGLAAIAAEAASKEQAATSSGDPAGRERAAFYRAVQISAQGVTAYAAHLAAKAEALARTVSDPTAAREFAEMAAVCRKVPAGPAGSFREAVNAIWISQVAIHAENINMAMSPGRLDQVLYPYYRRDVEAGRLTVAQALELVGCLWAKLADNVITVPEASEQMFGGAGTVPAVTLGGVDEAGGDAVNDLTYVMLRATELMRIRDPNVNARWHTDVNPPEYARRVAEVVLETQAVPALYNDVANVEALTGQGESLAHARDYAVIGCVELASAGRDFAASSSILLNLVAALEMALFRGKRPITGDEQVGPVTPAPEAMGSFEEFRRAFTTQLDWLVGQAVEVNEMLGAVHQEVMPSPLLSAYFHGPLEKGLDLTRGGAIYNSSGATHIGFADVVDSLNAIEQAVFADRKTTLGELVAAVRANFERPGDAALRAYLRNKAPKYGTEHPVALRNSRWLVEHLFEVYQGRTNYRGGPYRPAYWTMTNHAGLGAVTGALPSGRGAKELLASGITPVSGAAPELTAALNSVASLGGRHVPGGWALNLKFTPEPDRRAMAEPLAQTVEAYFRAGGQQVQFNVLSYATLLEAKERPERHPELMVRVSGYSAYFKDLNDRMKDELITRTEYDLRTGEAVPFPGTAG